VAGGALVGLGVELAASAITGEKLDATRIASTAASAAVAARMSRLGHGGAPAPEPTTRAGRAAAAVRGFDPGGVGARLSGRLEGLGARLVGAPPEGGGAVRAPAGEAVGRPAEEGRPHAPPSEEVTTATRLPGEEAPTTARPPTEEAPAAPRTPTDEAGGGVRPRADEAEAARPGHRDDELAGPANRMNERDLIDATTNRVRVGDAEHDFRITRSGSELCSACSLTKRELDRMIEALPPEPSGWEFRQLRRDLEQLKRDVEDVDTRLASGESGVNMVRDAAAIAAKFRALSASAHPDLARVLTEPHLRQTTIDGKVETSPHLDSLDATVVRTEDLSIRDFSSSTLKRGEKAVYILRDSSGAVLKVGIAESGPGRFSKYLTAANNLGLDIRIEIAVVTPGSGKSIKDIETQLRTRLEDEGHVLPWDNAPRDDAARVSGDPAGRLGRTGQGTPFVRKSEEPFAWTLDGRRVSIPETVANLRQQGRTEAEIIAYFTTHTTLTERNATNLITVRFKTQIEAAEAALTPVETD
jgi:hypothetical protein